MSVQWEILRDTLSKEVTKGQSLYAILDSAREIDIAYWLLESKDVEYVSLYKGRKEEPIWDAAPYLVSCPSDSQIFRWILAKGWGHSWGVFLTSTANLETLCAHLQQFLLVKTEDDKEFHFRFYDPRVLRVFSTTCTADEIRQFFGPVTRFLMESEQPNHLVRQTVSVQGLRQEEISLAAAAQSNTSPNP
ncbi:MAG: DUF4123 domain-containing protein [Deltaproteobacteria bacterium]|nr:DUF4123 domain-containing protein [Deltaproteobacteria bacterium]